MNTLGVFVKLPCTVCMHVNVFVPLWLPYILHTAANPVPFSSNLKTHNKQKNEAHSCQPINAE